jgi:hypothetical protein
MQPYVNPHNCKSRFIELGMLKTLVSLIPGRQKSSLAETTFALLSKLRKRAG